MNTYSAVKTAIRPGDRKFIGVIGDQDTITGLLLAGVGEIASSGQQSAQNCILVQKDTPKDEVIHAYRSLCDRKEIGMILINQFVADKIRETVDSHDKIIPAVLEIPSSSHVYDFSRDSMMVRISKLLGEDN